MESLEMVAIEEKPIKAPTIKTLNSIWPKVKPFANGGVAGMLSNSCSYFYLGTHGYLHFLLHKVKRISGPQYDAIFKELQSNVHHVNILFKHIRVSLLLEAVYTTARLGSFEVLRKRVESANDGRPLTLYQEACCGLTAGAIGTFIGSPIYLAYFRMHNDYHRPSAQRLNYRNLFSVLHHMVADNGVLAMWKGASHYAYGAMALSTGMLASYNRSSTYLNESLGLSEWRTLLGAGTVSGFFASACSLPFENVSKIMLSTKPDANGKYPYSGFLDCALKILKSDGPSIFYTGFLKYFAKTAPHIMVTWILLEEIRKAQESIGL